MMEAMNPKEYLLSTLTKAGGEEDLIASPQNTIAVLQKYDFQFKKQFGQNFLVDLHVLGKILRAAEIGSEDVCLEIGPGIGSLTQLMGEAAKRVISVEIDNRLIPLLEENLAAVSDTAPLSVEEKAAFQKIRSTLGTQFCRRCNYCQPCSQGINISGVFLFEGYLTRYGLGEWAKGRYNAMSKYASDCIGCGACEQRCPYQLPIRKMLAKAAAHFGE